MYITEGSGGIRIRFGYSCQKRSSFSFFTTGWNSSKEIDTYQAESRHDDDGREVSAATWFLSSFFSYLQPTYLLMLILPAAIWFSPSI